MSVFNFQAFFSTCWWQEILFVTGKRTDQVPGKITPTKKLGCVEGEETTIARKREEVSGGRGGSGGQPGWEWWLQGGMGRWAVEGVLWWETLSEAGGGGLGRAWEGHDGREG